VVQYCPPSGGNGNFVVTLTNTGNGTATNIYITVNGSPSGPFSVTPGENQTHSFPLGTTADVPVQVTWVTDQGQQVLLLNTKVPKCPPVPTPTPTPTPSPSPTPTPTPSPTPTPPPHPSIKISSHIDLNQISAGKTSGPLSFTVTASDAGGSVTVDPGNGGVSDCNGGPVRSDITFDHLAAGNNPECIIVTAPDDADKPATGSVAYSATLTTSGGTSTDSVVDGYNIKYPIQT
jgi:hypothetical protein